MFDNYHLHLEFMLPFRPAARGQGRGNSGLYQVDMYENQILDSFGLEGKNNECGGIYSIKSSIVNACFPPLTWQTYDVEFTNAKSNNGKKTKNARISKFLAKREVPDPTRKEHQAQSNFKAMEIPSNLKIFGLSKNKGLGKSLFSLPFPVFNFSSINFAYHRPQC